MKEHEREQGSEGFNPIHPSLAQFWRDKQMGSSGISIEMSCLFRVPYIWTTIKHTVDGPNPGPPKKPWKADSLVSNSAN